MNVFNRILAVLAILVALAVVLLVMLYPLDAVDVVKANLDQFEESLFDNQFFYLFLAVSGAVELLLLVLLWLEVRRPRRRTVRVKTKEGGRAQLGIESVSQSLEYRIDELAGVRRVAPHVVSRGRDVDVIIELDTSPSVNIPVLTDQIMDLCHDIVEGQLGVKIHGKPDIRITHEPYPRGTMPSTGPLGMEAVASPPAAVEPKPIRAPKPVQPIAPEPEPTSPVVVEPAPLLEESSSEEIFSDEEQQDKEDVSSGW